MKKLILFSLLLSVCGLPAFAQQTQYKEQLETIFKSFRQKDYAQLKPLLDPKVKIGTLPTGYNDAVIPQVLNQLPTPESYTVTGMVQEGANTRVNTDYHYAGGSTRKQNFVFDPQKKIVEMDILGDAQVSTMEVPQSDPAALPDSFSADFEVHSHLIFLNALLNGKEETFILDCGAPLLILNKEHFDSDTLEGAMAKGIGGSVAMGKVHVDSFNWNGIKMKDFDAVTLSLKHLEKECKHHFAGLIGYSVFKDYAVTYDYKNRVITFVKTDADGNTKHTAPGTPVCTVPLQMHAHIAIIPMSISGKTYKMGIDCGASGNLLYAKYLPDIKESIARKKKRKLGGAGKATVKVVYAKVKTAMAGTADYKNMVFAFDDGNLTQLNSGYGLDIDGLVGYEFLKRYKTTVNYKKKEVTIYLQ